MLRSETAQQPERMARALDGLRRYQDAERGPVPKPMPAIAEARGAALRDYGGDGPAVVFVPSLINPPNILDLAGKSMLRWLALRGHRVFLVDWGWEVEQRRSLSIAGHVEEILLPLVDAIARIETTAEVPPALVGYCLGGTMASAAAALTDIRGLATIAAPWRFAGYPADARALLAALWQQGAPTAERLGVLPMEMLQSAFWSLDPARTVSKFERLASLPPGSDEERNFILLEDWANDGPPIGEAAARELFGFFAEDAPGAGAWSVGGRAIDPQALACPRLNIVSTTDRIVPASSSVPGGERLDIALGHVGMVVGGRGRALLWEPLSDWLFRTAASC